MNITQNLSANHEVDLINCDQEPIHQLGKIQKDGFLMGFDYQGALKCFSSNLEKTVESFAKSKASPLISDFFQEQVTQSFEAFVNSKNHSLVNPGVFIWQEKNCKIHFAKSGSELILIEVEDLDSFLDESIETDLTILDSLLNSLPRIDNERDMATNAVINFKKMTGFDRVMYYKFDENGDGEILAEEKSLGLESFLGLRYPASDIPQQARELYKKNLIRSIPDINDPGIPVYGLNNSKVLDLSYSVFRSVSPVHTQYLKNMGVTASFGTTILNNGELSGMIICHNYNGAKKLSLNRRLLSLFFTNGLSLWQQTVQMKEKNRLWQLQKELFKQIREHIGVDSFRDLISFYWPVISKELKLCGFTVHNKLGILHHEDTFSDAEVLKLVVKLKMQEESVAQTSAIYYDNQEDLPFSINSGISGIAGLVGFCLNDPEDTVIIFYRSEKTRVYKWAGKQEKTDTEGGLKGLSPRKSFEQWQELVKGKSIPWDSSDKSFISELGTSLLANALRRYRGDGSNNVELMMERKINELNYSIFLLEVEKTQMQEKMNLMVKTVQEADRFNELKKVIMSNMSHEMRTPLNGIMGLATLINESKIVDRETREFSELIFKSGERMLHTFNRLMELDFSTHNKNSDKSAALSIGEFLEKYLSPIASIAAKSGKSLKWKIHNKLESIVSNEIIVAQIIINLVNNALKYSGTNAEVLVQVKFLNDNGADNIQFSIEDNGPGIQEKEQDKIYEPFYMSSSVTRDHDNSSGLGLYIVKSYTEYLGGKISLSSIINKGSIFTISIPT